MLRRRPLLRGLVPARVQDPLTPAESAPSYEPPPSGPPIARRFNPKALGVSFPKIVKLRYHRFTDYFKGFETVAAVRGIFGARTAQALRNLQVEFFSSPWGYMGVSDKDGHLLVSTHYLRTGNRRDVYLDVIHELVHVKQFRDGRRLFPENFEYANAPTEVEAYKVCIAEGRRIGMTDRDVLEYLKVPWMEDKDWRRLARNLGIRPPKPRTKR